MKGRHVHIHKSFTLSDQASSQERMWAYAHCLTLSGYTVTHARMHVNDHRLQRQNSYLVMLIVGSTGCDTHGFAGSWYKVVVVVVGCYI